MAPQSNLRAVVLDVIMLTCLQCMYCFPVIRAMLVSDRQPSRAQPPSSCVGMMKMEWHEQVRNGTNLHAARTLAVRSCMKAASIYDWSQLFTLSHEGQRFLYLGFCALSTA